MSYLTENANLLFPITEADRQQALKFSKQTTAEKAEKIYRNTLAILIVEHYLKMLGIETNRGQSYSWDAITQLTSDMADLYIPEAGGRLECRPVKPGEQKCLISEDLLDSENGSDRIGFIAVELNESFTSGIVIGFVTRATVEELPLSYFRSLDDLIDQVDNWVTSRPSRAVLAWFKNVANRGWRESSALIQEFAPSQPEFTRQFRKFDESRADLEKAGKAELIKTIQTTESEETRWQAADRLWSIDPEHPACGVSYATLLKEFSASQIGLSVAGLQKEDHTMSFFVRLVSLDMRKALPMDIELSLIDESGVTQYSTKPQTDEAGIQKKFNVNSDENFKIRISQGSVVIEEEFVSPYN